MIGKNGRNKAPSSQLVNLDRKGMYALISIAVSLFFILGIGIGNRMATTHMPTVGAMALVLIGLLVALGGWLFIKRKNLTCGNIIDRVDYKKKDFDAAASQA